MTNDLISRQAAIDATWFEPSYTDPLNVLTEVRDRLEQLPSADAAPVRHGHWIKNDPHCDVLAFLWNCSECGGESDEGYRYCPSCGARMDGEK